MPYRLLIIDDEKLMREGLVDYIDWRSLNISVVATASDGVEGMRLTEQYKPDIILSDIHMPDMDGIDLIKEIRSKNINAEIIFISAYSEFVNAQNALRYSAFDYLLKPISEQTLYSCMERCVTKIIAKNVKAQDAKDDLSALNRHMENLYNAPEPYTEKTGRLFSCVLDVDFTSLQKALVVAAGDKLPDFYTKLAAAVYGSVIVKTAISSEVAAYFIVFHDLSMAEVKNRIERGIGTDSTSFVFAPVNHDVLYTVYVRSLYQLLVANKLNSDETLIIEPENYFKKIKLLIDEFIDSMDVRAQNRFIALFLKYHYEHKNLFEVKKFIKECIFAVDILFNKVNERYLGLFNWSDAAKYNTVQQLINSTNIYDASKLLENIFLEVLSQTRVYWGKHKMTAQVLNYIHAHFADNICLKQLAELIHVSPSHLSHVFKDDLGCSITQYIINYRMSVANRILKNSNLKIYEIASSVGYNDVIQFTKMYKKLFGYTPKQTVNT